MYRGFNLDLNWHNKYDDEYFNKGQALYASNKKQVAGTLKSFVANDGVLDGSKMQSNWFPQVSAEVFISHSHKDEKRAIAFAGWLFDTFNITAFIDSCIWEYADDLLKIIDNDYCRNEGESTYNYKKRNYSTSHVHMMLSIALSMMIDKTECLFFLNTPSSISSSEVVSKTESPWIYSEIAISQIIRQKVPKRRKIQESKYFSKGGVINEQLRIEHEVGLAHLRDIDVDNLNDWKKNNTSLKSYTSLDVLYDLVPIKDPNLFEG